MATLLYIQASPRTERSHSSKVADAFVEAYRKLNPDDEIDKLNLFQEELPAFDGLAVQAKYTILHGKSHTAEEAQAWQAVEAVIERFKSADKYVISNPMWNFNISYRLKQYIDLIVQPGYTFSFSPETGYEGLIKGKPILLVNARGGAYPPDSEQAAYDFQSRYLDAICGFMGFTDIRRITVEPTLDASITEKESELFAQARELAKTF